MAGITFSAQLTGVSELVDTLNKLMANTKNLHPALAQVGEYLLESHQARFQLEVAPDGTPWAPLAPETLARKKGEDRILQDQGTLRDTLSYDVSANELFFGSNLEYAATHQFGREEDGIEARPFIGFSEGPWQDSVEILVILREHLTNR
ncbi:phage virion morphogenesis protein [Rheinheimera sp. 4Y26]|uniref:phage virion morphogenesis protein n=1 Tax=Rheinheimera sp. 4Y26 TaxID=2977811 RepID=UPI0021B0D7BD|nr:phage virion morphogenesis protein [Rheinheimera sp. 4Y26]MCT6700914.1 phage virion morphogenesis protein [Rheinheimera sp. 4Y26]